MNRTDQSVEPHLFVVLGATGDLMQRKLLPALYHLTAQGALRNRCQILGVALDDDLEDRGFRAWARQVLAAACPLTSRRPAGVTIACTTSLWAGAVKGIGRWRRAS